VLLLALGLILSLGFTSWADPFGMSGPRGHHWGHCGHHGKFAKLTPEEAGKLFDLRQKYLDDTASLRKDMVVKRAELRALWRAENPEEKQILAKLKEINAVKAKLQEKAVPAMIEVKKILPKHEHKKQLGMEDSDTDEETNMAMEFGIPGDVGL
jgi:Spy/CpxP family protein refolding chaperone